MPIGAEMIGSSMSNRSVRRVRSRIDGSICSRIASPLALRAPERRAPILRKPPHDAAAAGALALFAFAVVDLKRVLEIAEFAGGLAMVAQRGAAGLDGLIQHRVNSANQTLGMIGWFAP